MKQGFEIVLTACVGLSLWLSHYIPSDVFDGVISPLLFAATVSVSFMGAFLVFRHAEGIRMRKVWAWALLVWGTIDLAYILSGTLAPLQVMNIGAYNLTTLELLIGNLLGYALVLYPTVALRPGWLTIRHAMIHLLPMFALVALDYVVPFSLRLLISMYPFALIAFLISHIKAYRNWCEENFSTLEEIDVRWLIHYLWMVVLVGIVYIYICVSHSPCRGFTQLWLTIFMFVYSTEQILYRRDPWTMVRQRKQEKFRKGKAAPENHPWPENDDLRRKLDEWMEQEKPFTHPDFQLVDLGEVLPMNRTYLSRFIKSEYGCSFYQFVNRHRIEEAKRLKREHPEMKMEELATRCGFSSRNVFTSIFTRETGKSPRDWFKKM